MSAWYYDFLYQIIIINTVIGVIIMIRYISSNSSNRSSSSCSSTSVVVVVVVVIVVVIVMVVVSSNSRSMAPVLVFRVLLPTIHDKEKIVKARHYCPSLHYSDVIFSGMASQITGVSMDCSTVCSGTDQNKTSKLRIAGLGEGNSSFHLECVIQNISATWIPWSIDSFRFFEPPVTISSLIPARKVPDQNV